MSENRNGEAIHRWAAKPKNELHKKQFRYRILVAFKTVSNSLLLEGA
jgi:hypothetical protein